MSQKKWCIEIGYSPWGEMPTKWETHPMRMHFTDTWANYSACELVATEVRKTHDFYFVRIRRIDRQNPHVVYYPLESVSYGY